VRAALSIARILLWHKAQPRPNHAGDYILRRLFSGPPHPKSSELEHAQGRREKESRHEPGKMPKKKAPPGAASMKLEPIFCGPIQREKKIFRQEAPPSGSLH